MAMVGTRIMYWISASPAGRLSAVAWPAVRIASLIDQPPWCGSMESRSALEAMYIIISASLAPGARTAECDCGIGAPSPLAPSASGWSQTKR